MKCHQRKIREKMAETPSPDEHLKIAAASSFAIAEVREISFETAKTIIMDYEWLGTMGTTRYAFGLYFHLWNGLKWREYLAGVECFGNTAGTEVGASICEPEHAHQVITLVRGACVHWAHPHSGPFLISRACDLMVEKGFNIFVAYSDEEAGEIGTIYQAANWTYVGKGSTPTIMRFPDGTELDTRNITNMVRDRSGRPSQPEKIEEWAAQQRAAGRKVKGKGQYQYVQTGSPAYVKCLFEAVGVEFVRKNPKHRYIYFAGDRRTVRTLKKALKLEVLPYPKRVAA